MNRLFGWQRALSILLLAASADVRANGGEAPAPQAAPTGAAEMSPEAPQSVAELLAQGRRYAEFHQFELALPLLRKAVETNPLDVEAQVALGGALIQEVVVELLSQARLKAAAAPATPGAGPSRPGEAVTSVKLNDAEALGKAVRSVELAPPLAEKLTEGEQNILVALKLDRRKNREALTAMGQIEFIRQEWEKARRSFTEVVRMNAADIEAGRWLKETEYQMTAKRMRERDEAEKKAKEEAEAKDKKKKKKKK